MKKENSATEEDEDSLNSIFYSFVLSEAEEKFHVDSALSALTGLPSSFFEDQDSFSAIFHPEDRLAFEEALSESVKGRKSVLKVRIRLPQGGYLKAKNILIPVKENGMVRRVEGIIVPISRDEPLEESKKEPKIDFRSLFQNVPVGVFQTTFDGKLIRANPALVKMLGYSSEEELTSIPVEDQYLNPNDRERWLRELKGLVEIKNAELKLKRKDGTPITVLEHSYIVRSSEGKTPYMEGILADITELKAMEEALRRSEEEKRLLLNSVEESVSFQDSNHRIIWANRTALQALSLPLEKVVGRVCYQMWYGRTQPCEGCPVVAALKTGEYKFAETSSPDGGYWLTHASPVKNEKGEIIGVVHSSLDITRLKKAEEALKESRIFLDAIISNAPMAISVRRKSGELLFVNEAWKKFWGLTDIRIRELEEKSRGQTLTERIPYLKQYAPKIERLLQEGGKLWIPEVQVEGKGLKEGSWISIYFYTLKDNKGSVDRLVAMTQDVTLEKMAQEEIKKAKADLLYSVSHELKTPVLALISAQEIIRSFPENERPAKFLEYETLWARNLDRLMALIDNLLDSQRSHDGTITLHIKPSRLELIIRELIDNFQAVSKAQEVEIKLEEKCQPSLIEIDPEAIGKSLSNVISNALKFSPRGGTVLVTLDKKDSTVEISVKDQGPGIPLEEQERLFNPFQRARNAKELGVPGTGLGLYVTKILVEKHGGKVLLESSPGQGTTVRILLPVQDQGP